MSHRIVGFAPVDNKILKEYVENQLKIIQDKFPNLQTELSHENDGRLTRYCKHPDRFPCFMVFKNNIHKKHIHAKLSDDGICLWVKDKVG